MEKVQAAFACQQNPSSTQAQIKQCFTDYQTGNFIKHKAVYQQL